jgi:hypothetical protein
LQSGKSLYIEGVDFGAANHTGQLFPMFGCTFVDHGNAPFLGNVMSVIGQDGSFTAGMYYSYLYQQGPDSYVDEIEENGGTMYFKSQDSKGRAVYYGGPANNYRAIHSAFIFGALRNGGNTKDELMDLYIDYLTELTGIEEYVEEQNSVSFSVFPNPLVSNAHIRFSLEQPSHVAINIYNSAGQLVNELTNSMLNAGSHEFVWYVDDSRGTRLPNGTYFMKVVTDQDVLSKPLVVLR